MESITRPKKDGLLELAARASTFKFRSHLLHQMSGRSERYEMKPGCVFEDRTPVLMGGGGVSRISDRVLEKALKAEIRGKARRELGCRHPCQYKTTRNLEMHGELGIDID